MGVEVLRFFVNLSSIYDSYFLYDLIYLFLFLLFIVSGDGPGEVAGSHRSPMLVEGEYILYIFD